MRRQTRKEKIQAWLSSPYMLLAYRLIATLLVLSISRWMLYLFNLQFFHQLDTGQALALYLQGMRFDLPIVFGINILTIIFYYIVANAIAVLLNFLDIVCFRFFGKHLTVHFLKLLFNSDEVSFGVVRQVLFDYWYLLVIFVLFVLIIIVVAQHTKLKKPEKEEKPHWQLRQSISLVVMLLLTVLAGRGGLQAKPISVANII